MGKLKLLLSYQNFMYCTRSFVIVRAGGTGSWRFRPDGALRKPAPGYGLPAASRRTCSRSQENLGSNAAACPTAFCPVKLARHSICRAQTSPGQNAGQVCGICKFSFARKSSEADLVRTRAALAKGRMPAQPLQKGKASASANAFVGKILAEIISV